MLEVLCKVPNKINRFKTLLFSMLLSIAMQGSLFRKHSLCSSKVNECLWYLKHTMSFEFIYLIIVVHFLQLTYFISLSVRMWDIRPFAPLERCLKVFTGAQHNFEKVTSRNYLCTCVVSIEKKLQLKSKSCFTWIIRQCKAGHSQIYMPHIMVEHDIYRHFA